MSSRPGYTLEAYLKWCYSLTVLDTAEKNAVFQQTDKLEAMSYQPPPLTKEHFAPIVALFEPHREYIEHLLEEFDEDNQSWRDYAGSAFDFLPKELDTQVQEILKSYKPRRRIYRGHYGDIQAAALANPDVQRIWDEMHAKYEFEIVDEMSAEEQKTTDISVMFMYPHRIKLLDLPETHPIGGARRQFEKEQEEFQNKINDMFKKDGNES